MDWKFGKNDVTRIAPFQFYSTSGNPFLLEHEAGINIGSKYGDYAGGVKLLAMRVSLQLSKHTIS